MKPAAIKLRVRVPEWYRDFAKDPTAGFKRALASIDTTLMVIESNAIYECLKILKQAGIQQRSDGGLYNAIAGGAALSGKVSVTKKIRAETFGGHSFKRSGSYYRITKGVGDIAALSKLRTKDGKGLYWEVLDQGHGAYRISGGAAGKKLKYPVSAKSLSGYKNAGGAYITKFRTYWSSSKGSWGKDIKGSGAKGAEGYGVFDYATIKPKRGIFFIKKTARYMKTQVDSNLNKIVERDFKIKGLRMDRRMMVTVRY